MGKRETLISHSNLEDFDEVAPDASAMIESLRAHGYTLSTAVADIIDNSIAARCRNVWLRFEWHSGDPWISITDDGDGMSEIELVNAMRLGSTSPLEKRDPSDLGRFGLGLKTASFSQARRLTVTTVARRGKIALRRWDLDHLAKPEVKGWQLLKSSHPDTGTRADELGVRSLKSGTVVLLEILDRVLSAEQDEPNAVAEKHWVAEVARVRQHLAMVFHRFLADSSRKGIKIFLNDSPVVPWDPFCTSEEATQAEAEDINNDLGGKVGVKGFVLPHRDRFDPNDNMRSKKLHHAAAGPAGWNAQQGFYLYRNRRLIIPGDWLGLGPGQNGWKKEEHFKLARIRVDIPNSMDQEWQIDVKKSTAIAPPALRAWLAGLAKTVREKAKEVYAHRGGRSTRRQRQNVGHAWPWVTKTRSDGSFSYRVDRKHTLFQALVASVPAESAQELETLLRLIEETVPVQRIWIDTADNQEGVSAPFEGESHAKLKKHLEICHLALVDHGQSEEEAWEELAAFPAFQTRDAQAIIGQLCE
jgi:hypothetical protein